VCRVKKTIGQIAAALGAAMLCGYANSEEVAPFRLTGAEGEVYVRYVNDIYRDLKDGEEFSRQEGKFLEAGLDVTLHSYIYHPNFFRLDFGGGPVSIRHIYDANYLNQPDPIHRSDQDEYLNFHSKAFILEKKPYPLILHYDRYYTTSPYAVQDQMILRNERYGFNFKVRRPLIPALVEIDVSRYNIDGENLLRITDETTDRAAAKISGDLGSNGSGSISYSLTQNKSASRSQTFDPDENYDDYLVKREIRLLDARTEHLFGRDDWIRLTNSLVYKEQDNLPELDELRFTPYLYLTHSKKLKSYYRYSYLDRTTEGIDTTGHALDGGLSNLSLDDRLETDVDLRFQKYDSAGINQKFYDGELDLSYTQPYGNYTIRYSGGWGADYTDQVSDDVFVQVRAEQHLVEDQLDTFDLENRNVVEDSIVIEDVNGVLYDEGVDYRLIIVADVTTVEWIGDVPLDGAGNPLTLLVSYQYNTGGTYSFTSLRQHYGIELTRANILRLYARYRDINRNLKTGQPFIPLNSQDTTTFGVQVDYPLVNTWTLGGKAEHETHNADVGSYRRDTSGVYLQIPKIMKGNLRLFSDWLKVDNLDSVEDVDLFRYGLRYQSRLWNRTTLTADYMEEEDTGGTIYKQRTRAKLRLGWSYRQLLFSAEARYSENELGVSENKRSSIDMRLSRRF
jgi:hypothetical protein